MSRRWLTVLLGLVVVVGVFEVGVRVGIPYLPDPAPWPSPETRIKAAQMEDSECVALAFLGTSVTEAAVDPRELGVTAYNAALPFSTIRSVEYWAEQFVLPHVCPETVAVGLPTWAEGFAASVGTERLLGGLENVVEFRQPDSWVEMILDHSELIRRRHQLKALAEQWSAAFRPERTGLIGPEGNQLGYRGMTLDALPDAVPEMELAQFDEDAVIELVETIRSTGADVIFLVEPARCDPFGVCPGDAIREGMLQQYVDVAKQLDIPVIDVWDEFDPALYADTSHLNDRGSRQFTELLKIELERLGVIP